MIKPRRGNGQPVMGASRDSTMKHLLWSFDKVEVGGLGDFHPTFGVMYGFLYVRTLGHTSCSSCGAGFSLSVWPRSVGGFSALPWCTNDKAFSSYQLRGVFNQNHGGRRIPG